MNTRKDNRNNGIEPTWTIRDETRNEVSTHGTQNNVNMIDDNTTDKLFLDNF